jgi:hypothetical protein
MVFVGSYNRRAEKTSRIHLAERQRVISRDEVFAKAKTAEQTLGADALIGRCSSETLARQAKLGASFRVKVPVG